ncbi:uncharacterized protein LOC142633290 [Castanea sativa]|uniref:uncharacterized protein LOC142633290 n=1 Tax=Castanea sativa TaxID=21020 RepID=UPI003F64D9DF
MNSHGDTPLHLAISNGAPGYIVEKLVKIVADEEQNFPVGELEGTGAEEEDELLPVKGTLEIEDYQGNTPLHLAASMGSLKSCVSIAEAKPLILSRRNSDGETPLFLAAARGSTEIFFCLHYICSKYPDVDKLGISRWRNNSGETILHCAIQRESWDLAYQIVCRHKELHDFVDEQGNLPLHLLANAPSAFISGSRLGFLSNIIYRLTYVDHKPVDITPEELIHRCDDKKFDEKTAEKIRKYQTWFDFFKLRWTTYITRGKEHDKARKSDEENPKEGSEGKIDKAQKKHFLWGIYSAFRSESMRRIQQKHEFSTKIMKNLIACQVNKWNFDRGMNPRLKTSKQDMIEYDEATLSRYCLPDSFDEDLYCHDVRKKHQPNADTYLDMGKAYYYPSDQQDKNEKKDRRDMETVKIPLLIAAKNGILEMVEYILLIKPLAIFDVDSEGKNIVLLAVEHKQPEVYDLLQKYCQDRMSLVSKVDFKGNSALHLAAKLTDSNPWPVPGAAFQMQWEIRWYKYIMQSMPRKFHYSRNKDGETPQEILRKTHDSLMGERRDWLSNTSNACSVVAGLLVTVTFPMSTTMPGGEDNNGSPFLLNQSTFSVFAISSYVSFYSSLIAVVLFLSVLTSAYSKSGFHHDLPMKLLSGLTAFYVSIASTAISFSAGHYFILKDKLKSAAFPAYAGGCLLVIFFSIIEFPLYFQLAWAMFKRVPQRKYRVSRCWF